ncbi:glutaredoxin domain-containing protein [Altererythrobacter sp. TH136]|uniref:glutaredoxin domain-containing protein n=1 Tax=Altererythrobacter sp. TH136 TaxID=2067415 RepID=UPI001163B0FD|nr:glutaredoxin domain-containing protein [Altererythrobacter sp. TH136]QDM40711.1 glutaredoxin [Altererythrobacter sp. TH136]
MSDRRTAQLYRMILPDHTCPFGVRAKELLESAGYEVDDQILSSREEVDAFKEKHGVEKTPQVFVEGERIGGSEELEQYLSR